jgi:hypothetical protein
MPVSIGEFEQLLLLAVLRLGDDAYGVTIRRAIEAATGRTVTAGAEGARVVDRALRHLEAMATGLRPEIARLAGEGPGKD